jgi:RNA polymerase sigma-70 factor, ECF subfamily
VTTEASQSRPEHKELVEPRPTVDGLFRAFGPFVFRALRGLGVPDADVDDAVQEVFVVVHRRLADFEGRSAPRTWIYGIAIRIAANHRARARTRRETVTDSPPEAVAPPTQLQDLVDEESRVALGKMLDELDEDKRAVFVLYELEELSMQEIAEVVQCPVQTAYSRLYAARAIIERAARRLRQGEKL